MRDIEAAGCLPPSTGWRLDGAIAAARPSTFDDLLDDLERLRRRGLQAGAVDDTLPERIATVSVWNLKRDDVDHSSRCAAAWVVIPTGMVAHGWRFRSNKARVVVYCAAFDFFDRHSTVGEIAAMLESCFVAPADRRFKERVRFRALLDRREHEAAIRSELETREGWGLKAAQREAQRRGQGRKRRGRQD
jgi:hypothetical protein